MSSAAGRAVLAVVVLIALALAVDGPSLAQSEDGACAASSGTCSGGVAGPDGVVFGARVIDTRHITSGEGERRGAEAAPCTFRAPGPNFTRRVAYDAATIPMWAVFYWMDCGDRTYLRWYVDSRSDPVSDGLLTEAVQAAFDTIGAPAPVLALSPSADSVQLTGMRTWLAIEPGSFRRIDGSVSAGEVVVTAFLEPRQVAWQFGNGDGRSCAGPGTGAIVNSSVVATRSGCSYTYVTTPAEDGPIERFRLSAQVVYEAGYVVVGPIAPGQYTLGEVRGPVTEVPLMVRELRAFRVRS